jgi:hypothetical protein
MDETSWNDLIRALLSYPEDLDRAVRAAAVLDEVADESRLPELECLFKSGDYFLREVLGDSLAGIKGLDALPLLLEEMRVGQQEGYDHDGLQCTICGLIEGHPSEAVPILLGMLRSPSGEDRRNGAWLLGFASKAASAAPLIEALKDANASVRASAVGSLVSFKNHPGVLEGMILLLKDIDEGVRINTASALGYLGDRRAKSELREAFNDPSEQVRHFVRHALELLQARRRP